MSNEATALQKRPNSIIGVDLTELSSVAALIFNSKVYGDIQTKEAAAIKIIAGMEYGFNPFQSMSMIDFIQGRPTLNAHGKATLINSSGDFRMKIVELTAKKCVIDVCRKNAGGEWKVINTSSFTWEDAATAELTTGKNAHSWKKYPRNMLFARCVSNIWRWDTPELNQRRLTPDKIHEYEALELQAEEAGETVDGEIIEQTEQAESVVDAVETVEAEPVDVDEHGDVVESSAISSEAEVDESIREDLATAVFDALADRFSENKMIERAKFLKSRNPNKMNSEELADILSELQGL